MIDLHIHTTATPHHSSWTPDALAAAAAAHGLIAIAATDHNTTASVHALQTAGAQAGVQVVAGVEIDSAANGKLWHTLIYGARLLRPRSWRSVNPYSNATPPMHRRCWSNFRSMASC